MTGYNGSTPHTEPLTSGRVSKEKKGEREDDREKGEEGEGGQIGCGGLLIPALGREAESEGPTIQGQPGIHIQILPQNKREIGRSSN